MEVGERTPLFIGLTTGNWITLQKFEGISLPHLLARGKGHGDFKGKLLKVCDEIFVLAPLGKIFMKPVNTLNTMLGFSPNDTNAQKRSYELVPMPEGKSKAIKLASTFREKRSILLVHSALIYKEIGEFTRLDGPGQSTVPKDFSPIQELDHLFFAFDNFSEETVETQLEIELPHPLTRTDSFKHEFFSIRP